MIADVPTDAMFLALSVYFGGGVEPGPDGLIFAATPSAQLYVHPTALDWLEENGWLEVSEVVSLTDRGRYRMRKALERHYGRSRGAAIFDAARVRLVHRVNPGDERP